MISQILKTSRNWKIRLVCRKRHQFINHTTLNECHCFPLKISWNIQMIRSLHQRHQCVNAPIFYLSYQCFHYVKHEPLLYLNKVCIIIIILSPGCGHYTWARCGHVLEFLNFKVPTSKSIWNRTANLKIVTKVWAYYHDCSKACYEISYERRFKIGGHGKW